MIVHDQELSNEYLDTMFDAIHLKIPANVWIEITKDHDKAVAAIKHFIDMKCYNADFDLTLSNDFKMFRKNQFIKQQKPLYKRFMTPKQLEDANKNSD